MENKDLAKSFRLTVAGQKGNKVEEYSPSLISAVSSFDTYTPTALSSPLPVDQVVNWGGFASQGTMHGVTFVCQNLGVEVIQAYSG